MRTWTDVVLRAFHVRAERVNSIGTCLRCGYYGPGPRHDCPVPDAAPSLPDDAAPSLTGEEIRRLLQEELQL